MGRLDVVGMIVSPRSTHTLRILVIRDNVVVVGEFFVADGANAALLPDFAVQELPHLPRRS